jgi:hypothetical protein
VFAEERLIWPDGGDEEVEALLRHQASRLASAMEDARAALASAEARLGALQTQPAFPGNGGQDWRRPAGVRRCWSMRNRASALRSSTSRVRSRSNFTTAAPASLNPLENILGGHCILLRRPVATKRS